MDNMIFLKRSNKPSLSSQVTHLIKTKFHYLVVAIFSIVVSACGVDSGADNLQNQDSSSQGGSSTTYTGPAPLSEDAQNFKLSLWDNIVIPGRCVDCHNSETNNQSPLFADFANVNTAYTAANTIVNLDDPTSSRLLKKVEEGHNCWLTSDSACIDILTRYIENWAGDSAGAATEINFHAPQIKDPGATKTFPEDTSGFSATIYPLVTAYCQDCHVEGIQTPFIASTDIETAYNAAKSRIDLEVPAGSRLVGRLRNEFHNCWDGNCTTSSAQMEAAINEFVSNLNTEAVDPKLVNSKALTLIGDGIVANAGGRFEDNIIALYEFKEGDGYIANDTSGVEPALNLTLSGNAKWVGGWGIKIGPAMTDPETNMLLRNGKAQASTKSSEKLYDQLKATGEYSIEAWVVPNNISQEDARIVSYSGSSEARNFTLGQSLYNYEVLHRSSTTDQNIVFATADADERLQASLQHVVVTFAPGQGRKIYVNGQFTGDMDPQEAGNFSEWDNSFAFVLGNETDSNSLWQGTIKMAAIHNRALSDAQITQNFEVGVGEKFFLLFSVSHLMDPSDPNTADDFIVFQASQMDSYSYLFIEPYFISLNENPELSNIPLKGLRLGINGKVAGVAQSFQNVDMVLDNSLYVDGSGQPISRSGTLIALQKGASSDEFFLSFEEIGAFTNAIVIAAPPSPTAPTDGSKVSDIGLKTFDEINASMSTMTGVATTETKVNNTFDKVKQQLPTIVNIGGFLSAHQMAMTQLAIQYCDALVEDNSLRNSFFPSFDFNESANTAFDVDGRDLIINPLLSKLIGSNLNSQPVDLDVTTELNSLIDALTVCANTSSCDAQRTATTVKAACAAVLGSATTLVQ
jgi:hypothetical protein|tara:strand:- start:27 stop:2600 length:2574 start_codon:yes stop_codon:yes gene_type:complete